MYRASASFPFSKYGIPIKETNQFSDIRKFVTGVPRVVKHFYNQIVTPQMGTGISIPEIL